MRKENLGAWVKHPVVEINKQWSKGRPGNQKLTDKKKKKKRDGWNGREWAIGAATKD